MRLDLSKIRTPHEHFEQVYPAEAFAADREDFRVVTPVSLAFEIFKDKDAFRLVGNTVTTLELPCSRCLEPMTAPIDPFASDRTHLAPPPGGSVRLIIGRTANDL